MSRGMSRGGSGFPIIIAVLGVLILAVIGIFIWMQLGGGNSDNTAVDAIATMEPTPTNTPIPTLTPEPEVTPEPVVTVPPATQEPTAEVAATPTPYVTAAPNYTTDTVWINVDALKIRTQANFDSDTVGKIPYGQSVQGDVNGKWMNTSYDGISGWIYLGNTGDGRACVVYSEGALQALDPEPDADEVDLISSIAKDSNDEDWMYVDIDFSSKAYSNDDGTGDISSSDFTITGGTLYDITSDQAGTESITLKIQLFGSSTEITVKVKSQSIFNSSGNAAASESGTFTID